MDAQQRQLEALRIARERGAGADGGARGPRRVPVRSLPAARGSSERASRMWMFVGGGLLARRGHRRGGARAGSERLVRGLGDKGRAADHPSTSTSTSTSTTTTTVAPALTVGPLEHGTVTVSMPAGAYTVTVAARGACWMQAQGGGQDRDRDHDPAVRRLEGDPRLGADDPAPRQPGVADVQVNGEALTLPASGGAAMNLQLNPAA